MPTYTLPSGVVIEFEPNEDWNVPITTPVDPVEVLKERVGKLEAIVVAILKEIAA